MPSVVKSMETEACANACELLKHLSHDANQPVRKFRLPDEWWKSSNNRLSTGGLFLFFFAARVLTLRAHPTLKRLLRRLSVILS